MARGRRGRGAGNIIPNKEVGARIREARKQRGLTQMELAAKVGVSFQQIQKYETGKDRIFVERLQQIAKALDLPLSYFFDDYWDNASLNRLIPKELRQLLPLKKEEIAILKQVRTLGKKFRSSLLEQLEIISELLNDATKKKANKEEKTVNKDQKA